MFIPSPTGRDHMAFNLFAMEQEGLLDNDLDSEEDDEVDEDDEEYD